MSKPIILHVILVSFASLTRSRIPKVLCGVLCSGTKVDTPVDPTKTHLCTNTVLKQLWKIAISSTHTLCGKIQPTGRGTSHSNFNPPPSSKQPNAQLDGQNYFFQQRYVSPDKSLHPKTVPLDFKSGGTRSLQGAPAHHLPTVWT